MTNADQSQDITTRSKHQYLNFTVGNYYCGKAVIATCQQVIEAIAENKLLTSKKASV